MTCFADGDREVSDDGRTSATVAPGDGEVLLRGGVGVVRKFSAASGGAFSAVEHPLEPGALAAPPHTHADVDEYSFACSGAALARRQIKWSA